MEMPTCAAASPSAVSAARKGMIPTHGALPRLGTNPIAFAAPRRGQPPLVVDTGLRAARCIGDGLYGVDLKETPDGVYVIEVNDNPTIAAGEEDQGNAGIYAAVIRHLAGDD